VGTGGHPSAVAEDRFQDGGEFDGDGFPAHLLGDAGVDELGFDRSEDGWLNWGALVQSFSAEQPRPFRDGFSRVD